MSDVLNGFKQTVGGKYNAPFFNGENVVTDSSFAIAAGGANVCEITVTLKDGANAIKASAIPFEIWLSDDADGIGLTATSASGTVQAKSGGGADFGALTAKKALAVQALGTGLYILEITDTAKTGFYIAIKNPFTGNIAVSRQLVTGDYGA